MEEYHRYLQGLIEASTSLVEERKGFAQEVEAHRGTRALLGQRDQALVQASRTIEDLRAQLRSGGLRVQALEEALGLERENLRVARERLGQQDQELVRVQKLLLELRPHAHTIATLMKEREQLMVELTRFRAEDAARRAVEEQLLRERAAVSKGRSIGGKVLDQVGYRMIWVPSGDFWMGSRPGEGGQPDEVRHSVTLSQGFYMGIYPVTQALYQAVMNTNPSKFKGDKLPVETVSWHNAIELCNRLSDRENIPRYYRDGKEGWEPIKTSSGYRLPTEAEWEYAARGGEPYPYAGSSDIHKVAWFKDNSGGTTRPVGTKDPNAFGLHDMSGNVWEWCWDWYGPYPSSGKIFKADSLVDPQGNESGDGRVLRGGCWINDALYTRVARRPGVAPGDLFEYYGFRLVRSIP